MPHVDSKSSDRWGEGGGTAVAEELKREMIRKILTLRRMAVTMRIGWK